MSKRSFQVAALAFAAASLVACASGGVGTATSAAGAAVAARPAPAGACTTCNVEIENRFGYDVVIFDRRDATNPGQEIRPIGRTAGKSTVMVQTRGRPNLGIAIAEDNGSSHSATDLKFCRQVALAPGSTADFRYACGN